MRKIIGIILAASLSFAATEAENKAYIYRKGRLGPSFLSYRVHLQAAKITTPAKIDYI